MYTDTWIVVANKSIARFFHAESNQNLKEEHSLCHPASKKKGTELESDRPGRSFNTQGSGRHHMGTLDSSDEEGLAFAKEISEKLYELRQEQKMRKLFLIASPKMLGMITDKLHTSVNEALVDKVDKDLTSFGPDEIRGYLPEVL